MLKKYLRPGKTVYTIIRHCSKSGMTREISLYTISGGELVYLSGYAGNLLERRRGK